VRRFAIALVAFAFVLAATALVLSPPSPAGTSPATPALDTLSMVAVVAALAAVYGAWQRRKWVQRKP